jgi:prophage regulatory protein
MTAPSPIVSTISPEPLLPAISSPAQFMMNPDQDHLLRLSEVMSETRLGRTTIYRLMGAGQFPRSIQLTPKLVSWWQSEIREWRATRPRTKGVS